MDLYSVIQVAGLNELPSLSMFGGMCRTHSRHIHK